MHMVIIDSDANDKKNISYDIKMNEDHLYLE